MVQQGTIVSLARGQYRLRAPLGGSAYGTVWRADGPLAGGAVAIKLVNTTQMARAPAGLRHHWIDSARAEQAFLARLAPWDGRHIVRLLDSGSHAGMPAMALELLDGDLGAHLATERAAGRAPSALQALAWAGQVNQALAKIHAAGLRYLDLKPGNLLLERRSGTLRLADFGSSRPLRDGAPHAFGGTPGWQAPEQFFPHADGLYRTDPRSDYFALGALLYWMACGRKLRYGSACAEAYASHGRAGAGILLRTDGAPPPTLDADEAAAFAQAFGAAGARAESLLRTLLAPLPAGRPRHALEISRMLDALRAGRAGPVLRRAA